VILIITAAVAFVGWNPFLDKQQQGTPNLRAVPFTAHSGFERFPDFSPEGDRIAYAWWNPAVASQDIYVQQIGPGDPFRLTTYPAYDYGPRWSPNGQLIAFIRRSPQTAKTAVLTIPAMGGTERTLVELRPQYRDDQGVSGLSWSPDGKRLAVSYRRENEEEARICFLNVDTSEMEEFTSPPKGTYGDYYGQFSPDGTLVAFFRRPSLMNWQLHVQALSGEAAQQVTFDEFQDARGLAWMPDGEAIVFSAGPPQNELLWRVSLSGGPPELLAGTPETRFQQVAVSPKRNRLAYVSVPCRTDNIWRIANPEIRDSEESTQAFIRSTRKDGRPLFSPDGNRIVFTSNRSGYGEIYLCSSDGTQLRRVTELNCGTGSPSWSPDGRQICFDSDSEGNKDVYIVSAEGGAPRRLTTDSAADVVPSWSQDGRWIYFGSNRSGEDQVWKISVQDGDLVQVTRNGGFYAQEAAEGKYVYYTKKVQRTEVWRKAVEGGEELPVLRQDLWFFWDWDLTARGIYYLKDNSILFLDFASGETREVTSVEVPGRLFSLSVSPDESWFLYSVVTMVANSDIMLVENFR
jgi:Tol biopolymer transport system component